jgi:hypothetical protein
VSEQLHEHQAAEEPVPREELAVELSNLAQAIDELRAGLEGQAAQEPFRDAALGHQTRLVRSGACLLSWLDVSNEANAAVAFLHLYDEYDVDAVVLGDRAPRLSVAVKANDLREVRLPRPVLFRRGIVAVASSDRAGAVAPGLPLLVDLLTVTTPGST